MAESFSRKWRLVRVASTLFVAWVLLSGKGDIWHLGAGLVLAILIAWIAVRRSMAPPFPLLRLFQFLPWQLWQIFISNLRVARIVLSPSLRGLGPSFVVVPSSSRRNSELALLGMAITLTPGTLTVNVDQESMLVHALDEPSARDIEAGVMAQRVAEVFQGRSLS